MWYSKRFLLSKFLSFNMSKLKDITKVIIFLIGGFAIVVVGGFMMRSIAKLWENNDDKKDTPKRKYNFKQSHK